MKYLIIGLGIYGTNLARDLTALGNEVIGADIKPGAVEAIKNDISTVYIVDSTDESALNVLPVSSVDIVIVAIGEDFGASIKTVALLKKAGVKHLYARAIDSLHKSILECLEPDRILNPEKRAANDLANEMMLGGSVQSMRVDTDTIVAQLKAPDALADVTVADLETDGIKVVAMTKPTVQRSILGIDTPQQKVVDISDTSLKISSGDVLTVLTTVKSLRTFLKRFQTS